jgi:hypothetical protein
LPRALRTLPTFMVIEPAASAMASARRTLMP